MSTSRAATGRAFWDAEAVCSPAQCHGLGQVAIAGAVGWFLSEPMRIGLGCVVMFAVLGFVVDALMAVHPAFGVGWIAVFVVPTWFV